MFVQNGQGQPFFFIQIMQFVFCNLIMLHVHFASLYIFIYDFLIFYHFFVKYEV